MFALGFLVLMAFIAWIVPEGHGNTALVFLVIGVFVGAFIASE
jgi:hypothetical protein